MGEGFPVKSETEKLYALSGKIMLIVIVVLLGLLLVMVCLQLYARWHVLRLRRRQRSTGQAHVVHYAGGSNHPGSAVDRGLELWILNSLPVFLYSSKAEAAEQTPPECAVCLSEFEEDEVVRLLPKCGHSFHVDCVGMWLHSHSTCPICRSPIEPVASHTDPSSTAEEEDEAASESDPGSSSWTGLCETCQHDEANSNARSFWGRRRAIAGGILGIRTEAAPPPRPDEVVNELPRSSPLLSLKRLLSISRKPPHAAEGTSGGAAQLDLEGGLSEPIQTTRGVNSE